MIYLATLIHGRKGLTRAFFAYYRDMEERLGLDISISFCYSDKSDLDNVKDLLKPYDFHVQHKNNPLGEKKNFLMHSMLSSSMNFNSVIELGSDDFVSDEYILKASKSKANHAGVSSVLAACPYRKKAMVLTTEGMLGKLFGAGRLLSRKALMSGYCYMYQMRAQVKQWKEGAIAYLNDREGERLVKKGLAIKTAKKKYILWGSINKGLDNHSEHTLTINGFKPLVWDFDEPQVLDVKTTDNIHSFEEYEHKEEYSYNKAMNMLNGLIEFK